MLRRFLIAATSLLFLANEAAAGTVTITSAGFAALPAQPPKNWPANINWPLTGSINGTKTFTISDSDAQQILSWAATAYNQQLVGNNPPPVTISAISIILAWITGMMNNTTASVQTQQITPAVVPPPISIQ